MRRRSSVCRAVRGVFPAFVWLLLFVSLLHAQTPGKPLTNDDIISLVKAGLSDAAIVASIKTSRAQFDLSPGALIKLKEAGVSNTVIEAMVSGPTQATASSPTGPALPASYGYYLVDEAGPHPLPASPVVTKIGLQGRLSGGEGFAVDGLSGDPPLTLESGSATIIVYQQNVNVNDIQLSPLEFVRSMQAYQFNMIGTDAAFFSSVYGRGYYDQIPLDLWRAKGRIALRIEPVEARSGMFRLTPEPPLGPGRYALYFEKALHQSDMIFGARAGRQAAAYYFAVRTPAGVSASSSSGATRVAAPLIPGLDPAKPEDWEKLGRAYLAQGRYEDLAGIWSKILQAGNNLSVEMCREGFRCSMGRLLISPREVSFTDSKGERIFAAPPSEITLQGVQRANVLFTSDYVFRLRLRVSGKNYNLDYIPDGVEGCKSTGVYHCPDPGLIQQEVVARWVHNAIEQLAKGSAR